MKQSTIEFKTGRAALMATTGLASAAALMSGAHSAMADGLYAGISIANYSGDAPYEDWSSYPENYELSGSRKGVFVGANFMDFGSAFVGGELAIAGDVEGDPNDNASYDVAYSIRWVGDAKLRLGTDVGKSFGLGEGKIVPYAFVGATVGSASNYYETGYDFAGSNFGVGIESNITDKIFVGVEAIRRNVSTYDNYETSHQAVSLRVGFKF